MFDLIYNQGQLLLLIFARVFTILRIAPVFSSTSFPRIVRILLAFFTAMLLVSTVAARGYIIPDNIFQYGLLFVGEILIGVAIGFIIALIMAVFQLAGQFFSVPVGFGAAQAFDPLAQIEVPLLGQFYNLIAVFLFLTIGGLQRIFLVGILQSFYSLTAADIVYLREPLVSLLLFRLTQLFAQALVISFPIIGLLILVYLVIGLIAKAAPQMNLLILGFPFSVGVAFFILFISFPQIADSFRAIFGTIFESLNQLFLNVVRLKSA